MYNQRLEKNKVTHDFSSLPVNKWKEKLSEQVCNTVSRANTAVLHLGKQGVIFDQL